MAISALAWLYSGPNQTGSFDLTGLGAGVRYETVTNSELGAHGLLNSVASGKLYSSAADVNLILFHESNYSGQFVQISKRREDLNSIFWHSGLVQSGLVISSYVSGTTETRLSFVDTFRSNWDTFIDPKLPSIGIKVNGISIGSINAKRDGEPTLTWQMFPSGNPWLNVHQVYLRIHQKLHIEMPWYWSDYSAAIAYHIVLFVTGGKLRAHVEDVEWGVESGAFSDAITDLISKAAVQGMGPLENGINALLSNVGSVKDVFYLPGRQLNRIGTNVFFGNTADDVTIVIVS